MPARTSWTVAQKLALVAVCCFAAGLHLSAKGDGDPYWAARSGLGVLSTVQVPRVDAYSWTAKGSAWTPNSWLWNVLLGWLYERAHLLGFGIATVLTGALLGLVALQIFRVVQVRPWVAVLVVGALATFVVGGTPRATAVSGVLVPVLPVLAVATMQGRLRLRTGLLAVFAVEALWVNLHFGATLGVIVLIASVAGSVLSADRRSRLHTAQAGFLLVVAAGVATLLNPYGFQVYSKAAQVRAASVGLIDEWSHVTPGGLASPLGAAAVALVIAACVHAWRTREYSRLFVLVSLVVLTLDAVRFVAPLVFMVAVELAVALSKARVRDVFARAAAGIVLLGLLAGAVKSGTRTGAATDRRLSPSLVAEIPAGCRVANDYVVGGSIILLRPDVRVMIDGRNDMYGRDRVRRAYDALQFGPGTAEWLARNRVDCVLAQESDRIVQALSHDPGWRVLDADGTRRLLVRVSRDR